MTSADRSSRLATWRRPITAGGRSVLSSPMLGSALADRLLRAAQDCGYSKFVVYSLIGNPAVRPLLARVADVVSTRMHYGVSETTFVSRQPIESIRRKPADEAMDYTYER